MSRKSKFLSLILRHKPEEVGITLDPAGWVRIDVLLRAMRRAGYRMSRDELDALVETNDKKRFTLSDDRKFIRAAQGHSIKVDLGLEASRAAVETLSWHSPSASRQHLLDRSPPYAAETCPPQFNSHRC